MTTTDSAYPPEIQSPNPEDRKDTSGIMQYEPEEIHWQTQAELYSGYLMEEFMRRGWFEKKPVLDGEERTWVMRRLLPRFAAGHGSLPDGHIMAAMLQWCMALDIKASPEKLKKIMDDFTGPGDDG